MEYSHAKAVDAANLRAWKSWQRRNEATLADLERQEPPMRDEARIAEVRGSIKKLAELIHNAECRLAAYDEPDEGKWYDKDGEHENHGHEQDAERAAAVLAHRRHLEEMRAKRQPELAKEIADRIAAIEARRLSARVARLGGKLLEFWNREVWQYLAPSPEQRK